MRTVVLSVENMRFKLVLSLLVSVNSLVVVVQLCTPCLSSPTCVRPKSGSTKIRVVGKSASCSTIYFSDYHIGLKVAILSILCILCSLLTLFQRRVGVSLLGVPPICAISHECAIRSLVSPISLCRLSIDLILLPLLCSFLLSHRDECLHESLATAQCRHYIGAGVIASILPEERLLSCVSLIKSLSSHFLDDCPLKDSASPFILLACRRWRVNSLIALLISSVEIVKNARIKSSIVPHS